MTMSATGFTLNLSEFLPAKTFEFEPTFVKGVGIVHIESVHTDLKYTSAVQEEITKIEPNFTYVLGTYFELIFLLVIRVIYVFTCILTSVLIFYVLILFHWVKNMTTVLRIRYSFAIVHTIILLSSITEIVMKSYNTYFNFFNVLSSIHITAFLKHIFRILEDYCYKTEFFHLVLLAIHDFFLIKFPFKYKIIFSTSKLYTTLILLWLTMVPKLILDQYFSTVYLDIGFYILSSFIVISLYTHLVINCIV